MSRSIARPSSHSPSAVHWHLARSIAQSHPLLCPNHISDPAVIPTPPHTSLVFPSHPHNMPHRPLNPQMQQKRHTESPAFPFSQIWYRTPICARRSAATRSVSVRAWRMAREATWVYLFQLWVCQLGFGDCGEEVSFSNSLNNATPLPPPSGRSNKAPAGPGPSVPPVPSNRHAVCADRQRAISC